MRGKNGLVILDDIFPHYLSAFRIAEYEAYFAAIRDSHVYSTASALRLIGEQRSFEEILNIYEQENPWFGGRVLAFNEEMKVEHGVAYMIFVNNAYRFIDWIEENKLPFAFTLYPGGGFALDDIESDQKLERVCRSPYFRRIIATQQVTYDYILSKNICDRSQIKFLYGVVVSSRQFVEKFGKKRYYHNDKNTIDLCFVAHKYMNLGIDKGYDVFVAVATRLSQKYHNVHFHVVGGFNRLDIDVSSLGEKIYFYGNIPTDKLSELFLSMDIILSPNRAFKIKPGAFDGFPTGSCVEAGYCGAAIFCTDPLKMNMVFTHDEDIVILPDDNVHNICDMIEYYLVHIDELYDISRKGQFIINEYFNIYHQTNPRINMLNQIIK